MIDESAPVTGTAYNLNRWHRYKGAVTWELHSVYRKHEIYRSRWKTTGKYTSMYGAMDNGVLVLGGSLDNIKECIRILAVDE